MKDAKLEKQMFDLVVKEDKAYDKKYSDPKYVIYDDTIRKVILSSEAWTVSRNEFGTILGRMIKCQVIGQTNVPFTKSQWKNRSFIDCDYKAGEYYSEFWTFYQEYDGSAYSGALEATDGIHSDRRYVNQANAVLAIKGDFSFVKD
jgi:hypothetical protein